MNERQSIIGFTEAELGFFLVLLCVVLWVTTAEAVPAERPPPAKAMTEIDRDSLAVLLAARARLSAAERARDSLRRAVDSLKSDIWPSCTSRKLASGPLLTLIALRDGRFRLGADTVSVADVAEQTAAERSKGAMAQCVHEVILGFRRDLSAPEYATSLRQIRGLRLRTASGPEVEQ